MTRKYTFTFPVKAITKDNEKIMNRQGRFFLSKKFKDFEKVLQEYFIAQKQPDFTPFLKEDLCVSLMYQFKDKKHPDLSNLPKSTLDAFNGEIWKDDKQIKSLSVDLNYGDEEIITLEVFNME